MSGHSKTTIFGNIGRDAELKYTQAGIAVATFTVAVNKVTGKGDSRKETVTWFECTLWNEKAESLWTWIKKGNEILVEGEVSTSAYIDKNGKPAAGLKLRVTELTFVGKKESNQQGEYTDPDATGKNGTTEEIPF